MNEEPVLTDEEILEQWNDIVEGAVRAGVAERIGDDPIPTKAFREHLNRMLEKGVWDVRMDTLHEVLGEHNYLGLPEQEEMWLMIVGDFMIRYNKFATTEKNDWHNAMEFIVTFLQVMMEEEDG